MRCLWLLLFISQIVNADENIKVILKKMDKLYRSNSSLSVMKMTVVHPEWTRDMRLKVWTKGLEKSFITILSPSKDKGISTLKLNNEMWNYFPKINKVIKVPPSMMMGSWMGSDFTNDDLVKESTYIDDHNYKFISGDAAFYNIELVPKEHAVSVWGKILLKIERSRLIPIEEKYFDEKNQLLRILKFDNVKKIGNREIPMRLTLIPLKKIGQKTIVEYQEISFDAQIEDSVFSKRNLQKRR